MTKENMNRMYRGLLLIAGTMGIALSASAQHQHHQVTDSASQHHEGMDTTSQEMAHHAVSMSHAYSLHLPMSRNGSGTGWLPDASPMYGYMAHSRKWMYMFHGNIFLRYNNQDISNKGSRGDAKFDAPNWLMAMGQRRVGDKGLFHFSAMFSLDPLFGGEGYPLLFQTGETFEGRPLVDRQHPHNLFSELAVSYAHAFSKDVDAFVYFGYPGEPALGPVAFMHRPSSLNNTDAPLGHHWQDATHITFGVATIGVRYKIFKLDGSLFTGREPGEARYGFDKPTFDSYSYRLTMNPSPALSMQVSQALIKSPEVVHPEEDVRRTTASVTHALRLPKKGNFVNSTLVWGYNDSGEDHQETSVTLETNVQLQRLAVYGRYENVEKSASELVLENFDDHDIFRIQALTAGLNYTFLKAYHTNLALGVQGSLYHADQQLDAVYGKDPMSLEVYLRISPQVMSMNK